MVVVLLLCRVGKDKEDPRDTPPVAPERMGPSPNALQRECQIPGRLHVRRTTTVGSGWTHR